MRTPLRGLPFVRTGTHPVADAAADLLEALGADVVRIDVVHGPAHAAQVAALEPIGAVDATGAFDEPPFPVVRVAPTDPQIAWAASGALALTGDADGAPRWCGPTLPARILGAGVVVQLLAASRGVALDLDPLALLGERAAIAGFGRRGATSVGAHAHLVPVSDGWVAINLARADDLALLPALLDGEVAPDSAWPVVRAALARRSRAELDARAALLGLPLGAVPAAGERRAPSSPYVFGGASHRGGARLRPTSGAVALPAPAGALVVDLSSLWAGPLATSLLAATGARVVKVEGARRPDGARRGPAAFYDLLNHGKECVSLDLATAEDRALLAALVARADVVVEASRPRVMAALGIDPEAVARDHGTTWISITGHGRTGAGENRVAFGDDAAAAAGLVLGDPPCFVADAVADPITGLYAAAVGLAALAGHRGQVVDCALVRAAGYALGDDVDGADDGASPGTGPGVVAAAPRARPWPGAAAAIDAHGATLRAELAVPPTIRP